MEEQKLFSFEYPIFSTNCIKIKFTCNSCGTVIEDSICEIPKPNLDGGDTHFYLRAVSHQEQWFSSQF